MAIYEVTTVTKKKATRKSTAHPDVAMELISLIEQVEVLRARRTYSWGPSLTAARNALRQALHEFHRWQTGA